MPRKLLGFALVALLCAPGTHPNDAQSSATKTSLQNRILYPPIRCVPKAER